MVNEWFPWGPRPPETRENGDREAEIRVATAYVVNFDIPGEKVNSPFMTPIIY